MAWPVDPPPDSSLQQGIYLLRGVPPPPAWRAIALDIVEGTARDDAREAVGCIVGMLRDLQGGRVRDLPEATDLPKDTFAYLVGYGASFFDEGRHAPPLTTLERPSHLVYLDAHASFPSVERTVEEVGEPCDGQTDLIIQFTGLSDHAVSRAAVEVWNLIQDLLLPIDVRCTFDGFLRDDGRSWIGFHDGVSNLEPSERLQAIECPGNPDWNTGGTYLAFLRLQVDIGRWRNLSRADQELLVGRDKITGWPIGSVSLEGGGPTPVPVSRDEIADDADWKTRDAYFNPPDTGDQILEASHVHRVNQNKGSGTTRAAHRIFRQGYEFLEDISAQGPKLGLNFISFQNNLEHLQQIMGLKGWLGDANFGGRTHKATSGPTSMDLSLLSAGGFFVVPPSAEPFPGSNLFS